MAVPIYQTTSYQFDSAEHAANLFALKELGNIYTRIMNPTNDVLEQRLAAIEGGVAALALASGQAASAFSVQNLARAGDNIVSSTDLYGGTWNLFANTLKDQGIETRFVDPADPEAFARATDDRTRAYYAETLPNPKLIAFPIAEVAAIGRSFGVPLIMDNTAAPLLVRPFDHGAAVVVYSDDQIYRRPRHLDRRRRHRRRQFRLGSAPGPPAGAEHARSRYHGAVWSQAAKPLGPIAYILKMRVTAAARPRRGDGPFNAFLFLQGLETLPLRMREHSRNALAVANFLAERKDVTRVIHPAAPQRHRRRADGEIPAARPRRPGRLRAGRRRGCRPTVHRCAQVVLPRRQYRRRAQPGDPSGQHHPFAAHRTEQAATGVTPGYVRLSVGLEHIDDILADLSQALDKARRRG